MRKSVLKLSKWLFTCSLLAVVMPVMMLHGCVPPPPVDNTPPTASAGADQTVDVSSTVTLDGSGSSDTDGDTLSFSWSQISGTSVTLTGADTATPTFTAPGTPDTLTFELTVSDGQDSDTDTVNINVVEEVIPPDPTLFIANFTGDSVIAYSIVDPNTVNGNIAPDANLAGAQTLLNQPSDIVIDAGGALLASNFNAASITGYDNAVNLAGINGNFAPSRNVQGDATDLVQPTSLAIRTTSDLLFVADIGPDFVFVFANASTSQLNGNLAPTRTIASAALNNPFGINFGSNDELYVANNGGNNVLVFANASNLNGDVAPTRTLTFAGFADLYDVYLDASDRLFVVNAGGNIHVFNNASTLNGAVSPSVTLTVQGASFLTAIAVDSAGNGYIVDNVANAVYGYDNVANRNGTVAPDRTLAGDNTLLVGPIRVFLQE